MKKNKKIALVYPGYNLHTIPSLTNLIILLDRSGYQVDVYSYKQRQPKPRHLTYKLIFLRQQFAWLMKYQLKKNERSSNLLVRIISSLFSNQLLWLWKQFFNLVFILVKCFFRYNHLFQNYVAVIGIDPIGLVTARRLSLPFKIPLIYFSLELLLSKELRTQEERILKKMEKNLSQMAKLILIQDEQRGKLLIKDNKIKKENLVYIPNGPLDTRLKSSQYLRKKFDIPLNTKIALHAGSLDKWTGIDEIVANVKYWPQNWCLVVHAKSSEAFNRLKTLKNLASEKVFFSMTPLPENEYQRLVTSADLGLAFYIPSSKSSFTQSNIATIGLSSGKIAYYLQASLPIIVNQATDFSKLVTKEGFGVAVGSAKELPEALRQISRNYLVHKTQAQRAFKTHFSYENGFREFLRRLKALE